MVADEVRLREQVELPSAGHLERVSRGHLTQKENRTRLFGVVVGNRLVHFVGGRDILTVIHHGHVSHQGLIEAQNLGLDVVELDVLDRWISLVNL